jgi:RNA polymerase-interacting CarD/CdnL/TRCF family regulator
MRRAPPSLLEDNMPIKVGDRVIHPRHGLGDVTKLVIKQFVEGEKRLFYEISFPGSTLWVPLNLSTSGIRKISVKSEIIGCRQLLKSPARPLNDNPRFRQTELVEHLKEGTITAHCEVVRDLNAHSWQKSLSGAIATFFNETQDVLCQEWAAVEGTSLLEAAIEIESLLEKGKPAEHNE